MHDDSVFHNVDRESFHVIGLFPHRFSTHVPNSVLISTSQGFAELHKSGSIHAVDDASHAMETDFLLGDGEWVVVEDGKPTPVAAEKIIEWRDRVSMGLVQKAGKIKGSPLEAICILENSADLRSLDLTDLASTLREQRANEDEGLDRVFLRVRNNSAAGQTDQ